MKKTTYLATIDGKQTTRSSHRTYTHGVVAVYADGEIEMISCHGTEAEAIAASRKTSGTASRYRAFCAGAKFVTVALTAIHWSQTMQTPYQIEYAKQAPLMRDRWKGCRDTAKMAAAKADILETLKLHPADCSYAGKLYAELDAIRDVEDNRRWWPAAPR